MHFAQIATVGFSGDGRALELIDQTQLPGKLQVLQLKTQQEIWEAIHQLRVRGAPAIGIAAAIGLYLAALEIETEDQKSFLQQFSQRKAYLASARPTASAKKETNALYARFPPPRAKAIYSYLSASAVNAAKRGREERGSAER